jgi:hypothetical protein
MEYKEQFPPETISTDIIQVKLADCLNEHLPNFKKLQSEITLWRRYWFLVLLATIGLLVVFLAIALPPTTPDTPLFPALQMVAFVVFFVGFLCAKFVYLKKVRTQNDLQFEIDYQIFSLVFTLFNIPIRKTISFYGHIRQILDESLLDNKNNSRIICNDTVRFAIDGQECNISEIKIGNLSGWLASCELNKQLTGRTYISAEGDKQGFAHITFWRRLLQSSTIRETTLEWNQFENALHVATDNPREAREILTPDFMSQLYDWWQEQSNQNIRIAFYNNKMAILFPDPMIDFTAGSYHQKLSVTTLLPYTLKVAKPSRHIVNLVHEALKRVK